MHSWKIVWNVTDIDGTVIGDIDGSGGEISWDGSARIQRVCRGTVFEPTQWADLNPFSDWLMPMFVTATSQTPLGLFAVLELPYTYIDATSTTEPQPYLADGGVLLDQPATQSIAGLLNERLSDTMQRVVNLAQISRYRVDTTEEYVGEPVVETVGTSYASTLTGLCQLANYLPPHFDRYGVLNAVHMNSLDDDPVAVYDASNIVASTRTQLDNPFEAPNVYVVVGSGASKSEIVATREVAASAPHSVANRGRRVVKVIREQGISSLSQAEQLAATYAASSMSNFGTLEFATIPDPVHDCFGIIEVDNVRYREIEWRMGLEPGGLMTHRVTRGDVNAT